MQSESRVSKGFLTVVPKSIRSATKIAEGDRLSWSVEGRRIVVVPRRVKTIHELEGLISNGGDAVSDKHRAQRGQL